MEDEETLRKIVNDDIIQELYQNDKVSITAAWCFSELGALYKKRGITKHELKFSDEEFAEYMHSCEELYAS